MAIQITPQTGTAVSVHEFEMIADLPENRNRRLEYSAGSLIEATSDDISSEIAMILARHLGNFVYANKLGRIRGADGGYMVGTDRYMPDVSYVCRQRLPKPANKGWVPVAPDLAVEVISPTDNPRDIRVKVANYLAVGTIVWLVDPVEKWIEVYTPNQTVQTLTLKDTLEGGTLLPGFTLEIQRVFDELDAD